MPKPARFVIFANLYKFKQINPKILTRKGIITKIKEREMKKFLFITACAAVLSAEVPCDGVSGALLAADDTHRGAPFARGNDIKVAKKGMHKSMTKAPQPASAESAPAQTQPNGPQNGEMPREMGEMGHGEMGQMGHGMGHGHHGRHGEHGAPHNHR